MASITIRKLKDTTKKRLRVRATTNGRSLEAEVREILHDAVEPPIPEDNLYDAIRRLVEPVGGIELPLPKRVGRKVPKLR